MYTTSAYASAGEMIYGRARKPVTCRNDVAIGTGVILPEINFTLPPMTISDSTLDAVWEQYEEMVTGVCRRAAALRVPQMVMEIELLPEMTHKPEWGGELTARIRRMIDPFRESGDLKVALRLTPVDIRENTKPPHRRTGGDVDRLLQSFRQCAANGADILSIESTGGKEVSDPSLLEGDIAGVIFALGILGTRDMAWLWRNICDIAGEYGIVPGGDTACAFGNTAMVLADQLMISKVFASVVRTVSAVRSLVAYEQGATGPGKDCGYENVICKAVTGFPMAMEGRSSTCAHFSHVGNIVGAAADLWSNESVANVKLLSGMAPVVSMEQLAYDCRLMNRACDGHGGEFRMRDWLVASDLLEDPQAWVLSPEFSVEMAGIITKSGNHYDACRSVALRTVASLREAVKAQALRIGERDYTWLDRIEQQVQEMPDSEAKFIELGIKQWGILFRAEEYGL